MILACGSGGARAIVYGIALNAPTLIDLICKFLFSQWGALCCLIVLRIITAAV